VVEMSRSDYMPLYLGPVTVFGLRLGDRFEVKLTSFEFRCFPGRYAAKNETENENAKTFSAENENDRNHQKLSFLVPKTKTKFGGSLKWMLWISVNGERC